MLPTKAMNRVPTPGFQPAQPSTPVENISAKRVRNLEIIHKGLCSNCEKLEQCSYRSTTSETWFCEEYSYAKAEQNPTSLLLNAVHKRQEEPETELGLCMNCEHRKTCQFPKPAGGVWFCGEYE